MNDNSIFKLIISIFTSLSFYSSFGQIKVVDMIPKFYNNETGQDAEPNLAVNPVNPAQIAGSAFTPNRTTNNPTYAPIYVSTNGGDDWDYRYIIPGNNTDDGSFPRYRCGC